MNTSILQQHASDTRTKQVNWHSYYQSRLISEEDCKVLVALDNASGDNIEKLLKEEKFQCVRAFLNLLGHISEDDTIQYLLVTIDDMLMEDKKDRVDIFKDYCKEKRENVWDYFLNLLNRSDTFTINLTARIIAKMACWSKERLEGNDLTFYLTWLKDHLRTSSKGYLGSIVRCLQMMLRIDEYRLAFSSLGGITTIVDVLSFKHSSQIQYQLSFCIWVSSFNVSLAEKMGEDVIRTLAYILSGSVPEKVIRIILSIYRNLIERPVNMQIVRKNCIVMVQWKVLKQLSILENGRFNDDDLVADIKFLKEKLQESIQDLSSFDEYSMEVKSGSLEWSLVHRSERFWKENASRLNEKDYELLKMLVEILKSKDPLALSVAMHDIGEYVRHYPRGKHVIEQIGGKHTIMEHLVHEDPNVRYEALLAVQKLMAHNCERCPISLMFSA